jgi:DnaJ-class molecular chaperone
MTDNRPDPMQDYEGYLLWGECHACPKCEGTGLVDMDDDLQMECTHCDGSGIDPSACEEMDDEQ